MQENTTTSTNDLKEKFTSVLRRIYVIEKSLHDSFNVNLYKLIGYVCTGARVAQKQIATN